MERDFVIRTAQGRFTAQATAGKPGALFLHGFGEDLHTWDLLWRQLHGELPALRYDLRGFGRSVAERDEQPFSHAEDLAEIIEVLNLAPVDLVGSSMGASIALHFALDHPQRVRRLVLISPGLVAWDWSDRWREQWQPIVDAARSGDMESARERWWQHPLFDSVRHGPAADWARAGIARFAGRQWIADHEQPALPDVERLHQLAIPTLLLSGDDDVEEFRIIADLIEASVPVVQRVRFPARGHMLQLEEPAACAHHISRFLQVP